MAAAQTKFWTVWSIGGRSPTVPHWTKESAQAEAKRLALTCPGKVFAVLACVDAYQSEITPVAPVRIVKRAPSDDDRSNEIPF